MRRSLRQGLAGFVAILSVATLSAVQAAAPKKEFNAPDHAAENHATVNQTTATSSPSDALPPGVLMQLGRSYFHADCALLDEFFTPDGKYVIARDQESKIWTWSVATGKLVKQLRPAHQELRALWFSKQLSELHAYAEVRLGKPACAHLIWRYSDWAQLPDMPLSDDESSLLKRHHDPRQPREALAESGKVVVRDAKTNAEVLTVVTGFSFCSGKVSDNGKLLFVVAHLAADKSNQFEVWDIDSKKELQHWDAPGMAVTRLWVSADTSILAATGYEGDCWDIKTGRRLVHFAGNSQRTGAVAFSPSLEQVAVAFEGEIRTYELPGGRLLRTLPTHDSVFSMCFSPDGNLLAVKDFNSPLLYLFNLQTGKLAFSQDGDLPRVDDVAFSPDGKRLVAIDSWDRALAIWDLPSRRPIATARISERFFAPIAPAEQRVVGDNVLVSQTDLIPTVWRIDEARASPRTDERPTEPFVAAASRNGALLAAEADGSIELVTFGEKGHGNAAHRRKFRGCLADVLAVAISANGERAARLARNRELQIWSTNLTERSTTIELSGDPVPVLAMSEDGTQVAAIIGQRLSVWKSSAGEPVAGLDLDHDTPTVVRFSTDSSKLIVGTAGGRLRLYDLKSGKQLADKLAHAHGVTALALAADGATLFSGGRDGAIHSWKTADLDHIASFDETLGPILSLSCFGGDKLAAGDPSSKVFTYDLATKKRIRYTQYGVPAQILFGFAADKDGYAAAADIQGALRITFATKWLGEGLVDIKHEEFFSEAVGLSPDGKLIARTTPAGVRT